MSGERIAISVKNVSKDFRLPHQKTSSIKDIFIHPVRVFGGAKTAEVQHALQDVSFDVREGEFFGIIGRNGSGKSTLLKILAEIYQPTKGEVSVAGKLVPFIELGVGFNPELTGRENVYLSGALNGFSDKEIDEMYDDIVDFAELEPFMDQLLKNYSSGMQVRLAFSVATRSRADVLLIDEVLAVGDADFQRKCFSYFKSLKREGKTVVFVSHDMDAIREYCDRAVLIEENRLVAQGKSDEIATAYIKLFNVKIGQGKTRRQVKRSNRWGNESVTFRSITVDKDSLTDDDKYLTLVFNIKSKINVDSLLAGFTIKNSSGTPILGTNNKILKEHINLKEGEIKRLRWRVPNVFSEGQYDVTAALEDGGSVTDWWEDALTFSVYLERKTPYIVSPRISLERSYEQQYE